MRMINLIQVIDDLDFGYGFFAPEEFRFYKVKNLNSYYYYEVEVEEGLIYEEKLEAIDIVSEFGIRKLLGYNSDHYTLLTIVMEDTCPLYK